MHIERDHEGNVINITVGPYRECKQDILQLKDLSYPSEPDTLRITAEGLELYNVQALTQVLHHYSKRKLTWKCLSFVEEVGHLSTEPLQSLMETANSLQLCRELKVSIRHPRNFFHQDWGHVLPKLSANHGLEVLRIERNFNMLSSTDRKEFYRLMERSSKLRDLSLEFTRAEDFQLFLNDALARNQSLECLHLSLPSCDTNPFISKLADIIRKHPTLHNLSITAEYVSDKLREGTVDLLQKCPGLQILSITGNGCGSREYSLPILQALESHPNLIKVVLPDLDGLKYSEILKVVLPKLQFQVFSFGNKITVDENDLLEITSIPNKRFQFLRLEQQRADDYWTHKELFEQLLMAHPGVYLLKPSFGSSSSCYYMPTRRMEFFNELNWYGQSIYNNKQTTTTTTTTLLQLSHWPQLLYRVSSNPNGIFDPTRYPSVVFELLRSAEFLGKGGFEPANYYQAKSCNDKKESRKRKHPDVVMDDGCS